MKSEELKRADQISLLETCLKYADTGEWSGIFTYPNCGYDLVRQELVTKDKKITLAGRAALWLLGKAPDQTESKAVKEFALHSNNLKEGDLR